MWNTIGKGLQPVLGASAVALAPLRVAPKPVQLPQQVPPTPATPLEDIQAAVKRLDQRKGAWVALPAAARADMVEDCLRLALEEAPALASTSVQTKGSYGAGPGEELINIIPLVMALREYADALRANGRPALKYVKKRRNGQVAAGVFPSSFLPLLFTDFNAEVWLQPGKEATQGRLYRDKDAGVQSAGGVALVLGAGNQVAVVCMDVLHKLLVDDEVVALKMNPINASLAPHLERLFRPLVDQGFLEMLYGGATEGQALCEHPLVTSVHITGAVATFNSIVWGSPSAPAKGATPKLQKAIGGELGNVTPCIVVPGTWSQADLEFQADTVAAGLANNCGHNCIAIQVLVTDAAWPQREAFVAAVRKRLAGTQQRAPWYPGSDRRLENFKGAFSRVEELGQVDAGAASRGAPASQQRPFLLAAGLRPEEAQVQEEWWCTALQEVALPGTGGDPAKFLAAATEYANDKCWGQLAVGVLIHPATQAAHDDAFQGALEGLKYGSIVINAPPVVGFAVPATTWGAYPGNTLDNIGSGNCYVHNTMMLDHPEKSVVYVPWRMNPKPFWSPTATNSAATMHWAYRVVANSNRPLPGLLYILAAAWNALLS